jgi:hypothetical protein
VGRRGKETKGSKTIVAGKWIGQKNCDCDDRKALGGSISNVNVNKIQFVKPRGVKRIRVRAFAPCPDSDYRILVKCGKCADVDQQLIDIIENNLNQDPSGGCCVNGVCEPDMKTRDECDALGGKWYGACNKCKDGNGPDDCNLPRGACCNDGKCFNDLTKKQCDDKKILGREQFNEWRRGEQCPVGGVGKPCQATTGACCVNEWQQIGTARSIKTAYKVTIDGNKDLTSSDTVNCTNDESTNCDSQGTAELSVEQKDLLVLDLDILNRVPEYKRGSFPQKTVLTSVSLPTIDCNGSQSSPNPQTIECIPLNNESFGTSFTAPYEIKTSSSNIKADIVLDNAPADTANHKSDTIAAVRTNGKISSIYILKKECTPNVRQEDCESKDSVENGGIVQGGLGGTFMGLGSECSGDLCEKYYCVTDKVLALNSPVESFTREYVNEDYHIMFPPTTTPPIKQLTIGGPGTELKKLLSMIGINAAPNCSCNARAKKMDEWGADECEKHIDEIVGWLREESHKRGLPFIDVAGRILVRKAIKNSRKK